MVRYIDAYTLKKAWLQLPGTCGPFMFVWFALKAKGLNEETPILINTKNTDDVLARLWSWGDPQGRFMFPMSAQTRYRLRQKDAGRSVVQTNVKQWMDGSGATTRPDKWLDIRQTTGREYSILLKHGFGDYLGQGKAGLASSDGSRVNIPLEAFSIWYGRQTAIPDDTDAPQYLIRQMLSELHINSIEKECVFINSSHVDISFQSTPLSDEDIYNLFKNAEFNTYEIQEKPETVDEHIERIKVVHTSQGNYTWLDYDPVTRLEEVLDSGEKAILLVGAPRTGKSYAIRQYTAHKNITAEKMEVIQLHDGWSYSHLMLGQSIDSSGAVIWKRGPLLKAIEDGKQLIVLEEANRTRLSEALGELLQALEPDYREEPITLADESSLEVPKETTFVFTMNNVDKSTESIDDAFMGRTAAVEFFPRVDSLASMLDAKQLDDNLKKATLRLFNKINLDYPLGQGYFASLKDKATTEDLTLYYVSHIRPVLESHFSSNPEIISGIDSSFQEIIVNPSE